MSSVRHSVREFFSALRDRRTYWWRNPYVIFGFLWGLPIPMFSIGLDLLASGRPLGLSEIAATISVRPLHLFFIVHPLLFAIVFGAMGTVRLIKDGHIEEHVRDLALANERLMELDRMKKDFVANVTHELKTPLVAILGYVEMLLDGRLGEISDRQRNGLSVAHRSVQRLEKLIDELLEMARIEAGKVTLDKRWFDLCDVVDAAARAFEPAAAQKSLKFSLTIEKAPLQALGDPERIQRVLSNLISNAVKFTPAGGAIEVRVASPQNGRACITVRDSGAGIPEKFKPNLFKRFARADTAASGGTGLGLAIAKAILDAHGSQLRLESREGTGTEVTFDLECHSNGGR